mgnify:CR=1 FL=1|jgi:hypothetical protein
MNQVSSVFTIDYSPFRRKTTFEMRQESIVFSPSSKENFKGYRFEEFSPEGICVPQEVIIQPPHADTLTP